MPDKDSEKAMVEESIKQVSLKEFIKIVSPEHEFRNISTYIRVYVLKDGSEYFNRCILYTTKDYETEFKDATGEKIKKNHEVPYITDIQLYRCVISNDKNDFYRNQECIIFNLHSSKCDNFITLLKVFELTHSDDIKLEYYPVNNSQNNEKTGLYNDTLITYCRKYPTNGNKDAKTTFRVYVDNEYIPGTLCMLAGNHHMSTKDVLESLNVESMYKKIPK